MKKKLLASVLLPMALLASCTSKDISISGQIETNELELKNISELQVYNINLKSGFSNFGPRIYCLNDESQIRRLVINASNDLLQKISIKESGSSLRISANSHERYLTDTCEIYLYNCVFNDISLANACQMYASEGTLREDKLEIDLSTASSLEIERLSLNELDLEASGASSFKANSIELNDSNFDLSGASSVEISKILADEIDLELSGASNFKALIGSVDRISLEASGASKADMINVEAARATGRLSGASQAFISFRGIVKFDLSGASCLYYRGDSSNLDVSSTGGSSVKKYD